MPRNIRHSTQILNFEGEEVSLEELHQHFIDSGLENYVGIRTDLKGYVYAIFDENEPTLEKIEQIHNTNKEYVDGLRVAREQVPIELPTFNKFDPPRIKEFLDKS